MNKFLVSPLVPEQVPDFVREDYNIFVVFLQKYYEWLETNDQVINVTDELRNAQDVDLAEDYYVNLIKKEFLPDFPESFALDKRKFIKLVNNFYSSKGSPDSLKFLFRALYNEEIEIYLPGEDILKSSDGKWVQPIALRVESSNTNILNIEKTLITGLTSKATAIVEKVTKTIDKKSGLSFYEIYISKIEKSFQTGETVTSSYYQNSNLITVTGRVIGFISEITIDPNNRGLFYRGVELTSGYTGDPVSIVGGLNPLSNTPIEIASASARVTQVSKGSVTDLFVDEGGFGFRNSLVNANTSIVDFENGFTDTVFDIEATGYISLVDTANPRLIKLSNTTIATLNSVYSNINVFANTVYSNLAINVADPSSNAVNVFSTVSFNVFSLSYITLIDSGRGYNQRPSVDVYSYYKEELTPSESATVSSVVLNPGYNSVSNSLVNLTTLFEPGDQIKITVPNRIEEIREVTSVSNNTLTFNKSFELFTLPVSGASITKILRRDLKKLGSLGRIQVVTPGTNYANGDMVVFNGGGGYGANAFVKVNATGSIISVTMNNHSSNAYLLGGEAYNADDLPILTIDTASGTGAVLKVLEICGDGEKLRAFTNKIGAIQKITLDSFGYDYISNPVVSLRNADLKVTSITVGQNFSANDKVYQGTDVGNSTFQAWVTKYIDSTAVLRIHDYTGSLDITKEIKTIDDSVSANVSSILYYGDGKALATAEFLRGTNKLPGLYLNLDGQLSSDKYLQDGNKYHPYSYVISTKTPYSNFKNTLKSLAHPIGTKSFVVTKTQNEEETEVTRKDIIFYSEKQLSNTFNVSYCSNTIIVTSPATANLMTEVEVGDILIIKNLVKGLSGTVNVSSSSNNIIGTSTNFINDLYSNATINLSSGNTETVLIVFSANNALISNTINVTANNLSINVVFDGTAKVNFVNTNTIMVDSDLCGNLTFGNVFVRKITGYPDSDVTTVDSLRIFADSTIITVDRE